LNEGAGEVNTQVKEKNKQRGGGGGIVSSLQTKSPYEVVKKLQKKTNENVQGAHANHQGEKEKEKDQLFYELPSKVCGGEGKELTCLKGGGGEKKKGEEYTERVSKSTRGA